MKHEDPYKALGGRSRIKILETASENSEDLLKGLPPRSKVHGEKQQKTNIRVKYPIIRLLVLFFILMPVVIYSAYTYQANRNGGPEQASSDKSSGYETIDVEKEKEGSDPKDNAEEERVPEEESKDSQAENKSTETTDTVETTETTETINESQTEEGQAEGTETTNNQQNTSDNVQIVYHTVQSEETLYRISMKYFKSKSGIEIIKNANGINGNEIQAGQILKIPLNK